MTARPAILAAMLAGVLILPGCVAAIPLAAGGAILQSRLKEKRAVQADAAGAQTATSDDVQLLDITELPTPDYAAADAQGQAQIAQFARYASSGAEAVARQEKVRSALLVDPASLTPERRDCKGSLPAVLIDLDPAGGAVPLDLPLAASRSMADHLNDLRTQGVAVFWITEHGPARASQVRTVLADSGLDPGGADGLVLMRFPGERKQDRRMDLGDTICLLAMAGSERADFDELFQFLKQDSAAVGLEPLFGEGWFIIPQPLGIAQPAPAPTPTDGLVTIQEQTPEPKEDSNAAD